MASQVLALTAPTGLSTPTARVFPDGSDTQVSGSPFTLTEATGRKGYYTSAFTSTLAGLHLVVLYSGSSPIASGWVLFANADGTYTTEDTRNEALRLDATLSTLATASALASASSYAQQAATNTANVPGLVVSTDFGSRLSDGAIVGTSLDATATAAIADATLDRADAIETGWTLRKVLRILFAAVAGKSSGNATSTVTARNVGDTKDRLTITRDTTTGDHTAVTLDGT